MATGLAEQRVGVGGHCVCVTGHCVATGHCVGVPPPAPEHTVAVGGHRVWVGGHWVAVAGHCVVMAGQNVGSTLDCVTTGAGAAASITGVITVDAGRGTVVPNLAERKVAA